MSLVTHAPHLSTSDAESLARELFDVEGRAHALPSERDQNFRIDAPDGRSYVLKVANATEATAVLDLQNAAIAHLGARRRTLHLPEVVRSRAGDAIAEAEGPAGRRHLVRLLTFVPGTVLAESRPHDAALLESLGAQLAEMDAALLDFEHPAMHRELAWDLTHTLRIADRLEAIAGADDRAVVSEVLERFGARVAPALPALRSSVIHGDWNDHNVLVSPPGASPRRVVGAVDFGDMVRAPTVCDPAIAMTYVMIGARDPLAAGAAVVAGYHARVPLLEPELDLLHDLICARLALSVTMSAYQHAMAPENDYLRISERGAWHLLRELAALPPELARCIYRDACGLEPSRHGRRVAEWLAAHGDSTGPVLPPDPAGPPPVVFDLSVGSPEIDSLAAALEPTRLAGRLFDRLRAAGGAVGIGRYDEARLWYAAPQFEEASLEGTEWRTIHLGIDLFADAGTPVRAPLDGVVESVQLNGAPRDYGPTVILRHEMAPDAAPFFTLYGHLGPGCLTALRAGQRVSRGDRLGEIGDETVNGGWPPHLHLQVVADLLGASGSVPGVARPSRRRVWLSLCPDPNLILRIPPDRFPPRPPDQPQLLAERRTRLAPSLSIAYERPLTIVRGAGQYLFDDTGQRFLDAVNNVPHVGHCHPRVVEAVRAQSAVLNTNTRYLHDAIVEYARRLTALLPEPLSVCVFVCSGSEANELALRMARACTRRRGVIVVDGAYHGNTTSLVEISPYKCEGPGGEGLPPHVRTLVMPDVYRGPYRTPDATAGPWYGRHAEAAVRSLDDAGLGVGAFFCESLLGCGGQIVLPDGYLETVYAIVRAAGGVCVADEVQVGFGRVGERFWGFETQGVVPDIVTLGKPIGNGFPLGAVVTTPEIASAFATGMEYFNTFGGNPVACAAGLAVLDVVRDERLQERAQTVGTELQRALRRLAERHEIVGDIRGLGLYLGVELVMDRRARTPAPRQARYVANRLRARGVLLSTDGPDHNVLKIKPPLAFSLDDAAHLARALDEVLSEDGARPDA